MYRWLLLGLCTLLMACPPLCAEGPSLVPGPDFLPPEVQRLPAVEAMAFPSEEAPPAGEVLPLPHEEAPPPPPPDDTAEGQPAADTPQKEPPVAQQAPERPWKGGFELGLDGTEGNSQTFNLRLGLNAKRTVTDSVITLDLDYRKNTTDAQETAHRAFLDWRYEWLFGESPWTCFMHGTVDYDEFKAFDLRVTADLGLGYKLIKTAATSLVARAGGGFSHEIGSADESYVPEAVFGLDFERQLSPRQKLTLSTEYTPDVSDIGDFRLTSRAGWELLIDQEMNLSLKLSALNRYDSTPGDAKPNDLDYSAVLLWKF